MILWVPSNSGDSIGSMNLSGCKSSKEGEAAMPFLHPWNPQVNSEEPRHELPGTEGHRIPKERPSGASTGTSLHPQLSLPCDTLLCSHQPRRILSRAAWCSRTPTLCAPKWGHELQLTAPLGNLPGIHLA